MAAEGKAIIFYRCNLFIFYFVSIDERQAMSQPYLASWLEVVSIYKVSNNFRGPPQIWSEKNIKLFTTFVMTSALDIAYLRNETSHRQNKMLSSIYNVSLKVDLLSVTFDPETAEICSVIVTHPLAAIMLQASKLQCV